MTNEMRVIFQKYEEDGLAKKHIVQIFGRGDLAVAPTIPPPPASSLRLLPAPPAQPPSALELVCTTTRDGAGSLPLVSIDTNEIKKILYKLQLINA